MAFAGFTGPVDIILKKDSFTLQDLLDEDEILVEVKKQKPELLAFLTKGSNLAQMVTYIVELPKPDASEAVRMRYPVVCSELLGCEDETIEKALISSGQIDRFFAFFHGTANVLLSGVVIKVILPLLDTQYPDVIKKLKANPKWFDNLLNNLQCPAVSDFLVKFAQETAERTGSQDYLVESKLAEKLIAKLAKANSNQHADVTTVICDLVGSINWDSPLAQSFATKGAVSKLIEHIFEASNDSGFKCGLRVLTKLLSRMSVWLKEAEKDDEEEEAKPTLEKPDLHGALDSLPVIVQEITKQLPKYPNLLKNAPTKTTIKDQTGKTLETFSFHRLYILENTAALLDLGFSAVVSKLIETDFLNVAWDMLFKYETNPFCHRNVEKITSKALEMVGSDAQIQILKSTNLGSRLVTAENDNSKDEEGKKPRKPFMPFLHQQGNMLQLVASTNEKVATFLEGVKGWKELNEALDAEKKRNEELMIARNIGGDDEANIFKPGLHYGDLDPETDAYTEGHDGDADDLGLGDDLDMDSSNDFEDYDIDHAEVLLRKEEVEAFA